jgi:hypothetical protein
MTELYAAAYLSILCLLLGVLASSIAVELLRDFTRRGRGSWIAADWKPKR